MNTNSLSKVKKLTLSGMVIAIYVVLMYTTQSFAFGAYQLRIATALYSLTYFFPFLVLPLGIANSLSNIMGGMPIDIIGGFIIGIITAGSNYLIGKKRLPYPLVALPISIFPAFIVPIWLSPTINVPYLALVASLLVGQIGAGIIAVILIAVLKDKIKYML